MAVKYYRKMPGPNEKVKVTSCHQARCASTEMKNDLQELFIASQSTYWLNYFRSGV